MAQKPVLRGEVGCACVAREVSFERGGMGERGCARRLYSGGRAIPKALLCVTLAALSIFEFSIRYQKGASLGIAPGSNE